MGETNEDAMSGDLPEDTRRFLGIEGSTVNEQPLPVDGRIREPSFGKTVMFQPLPDNMTAMSRPYVDLDSFDDRTKREREARFRASADMLFSTDLTKLSGEGAAALYESVTEGMFGIPDQDGSMAFGKRAAKDPRQNIDMLRRFVKGEYSLIEDPEYTGRWTTKRSSSMRSRTRPTRTR